MKRTRTTFVILLVFSVFPLAMAQQETAENSFDGFEAFVKEVMDTLKVPGLAIAVVKGDEVIFKQGFGYAELESGRKVTTKTVFAIGSSSKAFTAACLALLVDQGKLEWDKPVREYLTTFDLYDDYAARKMTARDLLSHRSGLPRHDFLWYGASLSRKELFDRLKYLEPNLSFRQGFQYQNLMYLTAGILVEELYGSPWETMITEEFFKPLEMSSSNLSVQVSKKLADHALPYGKEEDDSFKKLEFRNIDAVGPAGSINSNVEDMANWVKFQIGKGKYGEEQMIEGSTIQEMHTIVTPIRSYPEDDIRGIAGYGMGWFIEWYRGHYLLHHGGNIDGFSALVAFMPHQKIGLVILTNINGANAANSIISRNVFDRLLRLEQYGWLLKTKAALAKAKKVNDSEDEAEDEYRVEGTSPTFPLSEYIGTYSHDAYGTLTIEEAEGKLRGIYNGEEYPLEHYHFDQFSITENGLKGFRVVFEIGLRGKIERVKLPLEPSLDALVFVKEKPSELKDPEYLKEFEGKYKHEIGQVATFSIKGEFLTVFIPGQPVYKLEAVEVDEFKVSGIPIEIFIKFSRDTEGKIDSVKFHQPNGVFKFVPFEEKIEEPKDPD